MNKMKKIIISIIVTAVAILGMSTIANAYYVGQPLTLTFNDYMNSNNIYCVEHNQALRGTMKYNVISQVKIEGNKSTDYNGKTIEHSNNAKFAAILSADNGPVKENGPVANGVWNFAYTWMKTVGQYHAGLYDGFASSAKGNPTWLDTDSSNYANSVSNMKMTDQTKKDNIKVVAYEKDGKQYMRVGPFNWSFPGTLNGLSLYDQNNKEVKGLLYSSFNGTAEQWYGMGDIQSDKDFYISIPIESGLTKITNIKANTKVDVKGVNIWFLESETSYFQNLIIREPFNAQDKLDADFKYDIKVLGSLNVIKVNKDNKKIKLSGVGFNIQNKNTGKYVKQAADGTISYVEKKDATEFITDKNGEILVKDLIVGTYVAYETKNPNYGYEILTDGQEKTITVDKTTDFIIENKQIYIKVSGFVWEDKIFQKQSLRNHLFKDNDYDTNDILIDGIIVRLKDKTGNTIKEAKTADGGKYQFVDVLIENLEDYYIEFEYDGLTYTNVIAHIDKDNGSKAAENATVRDEFNKNFSQVEGKTESTGITRDANGNEKHNLSYNIDKIAHTATFINNGQYTITANTEETTYKMIDHFTYGQEEIKYINLGLYEREQPNMAIMKDLENVRLTINGYEHTYLYSQRYINQGEYGDGFNLGVKFGSKYGNMSYSRAVYKADYEYVNEVDKSKELKVYVTYKLALRNQSTNLITQINRVSDYYDSKYTVVGVGTQVDEKGNVINSIKHTETTYNDNYSKTVLETNTRIGPQKQEYVYVQFALNREAVLSVLNGNDNLENVVEIDSYSVFDEKGNTYAGIDYNSNPGNVVPEDKTTYQDDTDSSPALKLEVADAREITGKVFLDSTSGELMTGKVRQGSGAYEEGETGIQGVAVTLTENTGSGKVYTGTTDANGDFRIADYIPGDYTLTYTWGDTTYTVQNYKGTVYDNTRNQNDKNWYKNNVDTRLTDAMDDYTTRQAIDNEIKKINNKTQTTIDKMNSNTPTMGVGVEYESTYTASTGDKYVYQIKNIDFGIVERARQQLDLAKRIKTMKVTLANGQVITDITIDENGNITGDKSHIAYMAPSQNANPKNGFLKLELDNELIQGAIVEVGYEIKATNNSELDYLSENFYRYGKIEGAVVTIEPSAILDYLDNGWGFEAEKNQAWTVKTLDDIKNIVAETVYNNENTTIENKTILYTESLKEQKLEPTKSASVMLNVSKILTTADEISFDNETEIAEITKTGGSEPHETPGNYVPGTGKTESDDSMAETVIVTPSTGANLAFVLPITIGMIALVILGVGVVLIKKKALDK